jgi:anaerobic selenocysteine-containing dehydrogenase
MNALLHELIDGELVDRDYVERYTVGFQELADQVRDCTPEWAATVCDVPAEDIRRGAQLLGSAERLLCTVLQGFYQSHQATAAAVQVNNVVLLRGMLGRPGCGVLQMNGQPTAENTRECGANGDLPGFRNWENDQHIAQLAEIWNVEPSQIPHYAPPTHVMQMLRYAEEGSLSFLWITGTNPAVSLPELSRVRSVLGKPELFVVAQDIFQTETTMLADVVLPAATWGEKTGTFTNADRTVHISDKAVDPPGEARADLEIFLDFARRMDLRDKDGASLVSWTDAESAFDAWKRCSAGRPCDYTGLSYERLRGPSGIQWPCTSDRPDGTERLYADGEFRATAEDCESYGRDLVTGASMEETEYRALNPDGKAMIKAAEYLPPHEIPSEEYPFQLVTGRTIYHFHTRTKTARAPQLQTAAPHVWAELCQADADDLGVTEGQAVEISSPRGVIRAPVRLTDVRRGTVFVPFHYGYWDSSGDAPRPGQPGSAANELTITDWDPVSKQPLFKTSAARVQAVS